MKTKEYYDAKKKLDDFLLEHPELLTYQYALERSLDLAGDDAGERIKVFNRFLNQNLIQLKEQLNLLKEKTKELVDEES